MEQGVGVQVVAGGGQGPGPQGGAGDGGVQGQDRGGPQFLDPTDGGRHLGLLLVRQADEEVDPDRLRGEPGLLKMGQGGFQFPRLEFARPGGPAPRAVVSTPRRRVAKLARLSHRATSRVMRRAWRPLGVWNRKVRPRPGQFCQDHQQVVGRPHQQGVVIEGRVREAQSLLPVDQLGRHRQGLPPPVRPAAAAGRRSRSNPGGSPGR